MARKRKFYLSAILLCISCSGDPATKETGELNSEDDFSINEGAWSFEGLEFTSDQCTLEEAASFNINIIEIRELQLQQNSEN